MCGIAGVIGRDVPDEARIRKALELMRHRGPDAAGTYRGRCGRHGVTLLHSRLAILDLDPRANQPFEADDCVLVHNGEVYNYLELKGELEELGHSFRTGSDTEVILEAYREWGESCPDRFEGMWAFALLDRRHGRVLLSRDRFGEKPLYYLQAGGTLYFASEVKFLAALSGRELTVNADHVRRYLVNGYRALYKQPATYFTEVRAVPAASLAVVVDPERVRPERYWRLEYRPRPMGMADATAELKDRLKRALELRLRADVPVAFCLSGGIDSNTLACIAAKELGRDIHAFSVIDRDERYDETGNIAETVTALGCRHHVAHTSASGFFERMADLVDYHDAPVATISYYIHSFLSEAISGAGYKVALSGTGADELFTGYYDHYAFWLAEMRGREDFDGLLADWQTSYGTFVQNPVLQNPLVFHHSPGERGHIYLNRDLFTSFLVEPFEEPFFEAELSDNPLRNRMMNELFHEVVPVLLQEDDANSMRWSVENRSPYLDRDLVEFAYSVPNELLIRDGFPKWLLRAAGAGVVPDRVRLDKRKRGFNASIDSLVDRGDPGMIERLLSPGPIFDLVRRDAIEGFLGRDMSDNSFSKFLFSFVSSKLFLESGLVTGMHARREAA